MPADGRDSDGGAVELLIFKDQAPEDAHAPEFRYLFSWLIQQARKAFASVRVCIRGVDDARGVPAPGTAVLLLGRGNVLCTARSFRHLRDAVLAGADVAIPRRLSGFPLADHPPLYTLRDYELLEGRLLASGAEGDDATETPLPIALFSGRAFQRASSRFPVADLLTRPYPLWELAPAVVRTGMFHEFLDYYGEIREDVLAWLPPTVNDVLEIGCGRGLTGQLIQDRRGCRVTGVELNPLMAREAGQRLWRAHSGDIETLSIDGRYDAIVATELFEHLHDPEALLRKLAPCLRPGGRIVLSIPNVGHYSVVGDLLAGRWDYVPVGLLCYTHVRFFTRATLEDWIERAWEGRSQIIPQTTEVPGWVDELPAILGRDRDSLGCKGFWVVLEAPSAP
jgi:SAM-dependent methyltransferase